MPLLTKADVADLASRVRGYRRQLARNCEQDDLKLAAACLLQLAELISVHWPLALETEFEIGLLLLAAVYAAVSAMILRRDDL